ncbi:VOC family protein [Sphingomonas montanisoli]|uniref:VOC family protein n=1 Tax=Sphingomonas montanisoli TaxID=2606412 RepID=A0A5D9C6D5_9SPHN|nr:VOC family protein [Sphingomonas montanisoli]TZG27408.1 VOC family protein [Sphingomonas montanisoli]
MSQVGDLSADRNWRIDHSGIGVADIARSARFYDAALGALGLRAVARITTARETAADGATDLGGIGYGVDYPLFWIDIFHPHAVRQHTAFRARDRAEVVAFHRAALAAGGVDNGEPGFRSDGYPAGYYAAFVIDPDGNNVEAVFRER